MIAVAALTLAISSIYSNLASAFYLPGVAPHSFADGEQVDLKVNKLRCTIQLCFLVSIVL
jgi:hypothetical protein